MKASMVMKQHTESNESKKEAKEQQKTKQQSKKPLPPGAPAWTTIKAAISSFSTILLLIDL